MFSEIIFKEWNLEVVEDGFWACECGEDKPGTFCLEVEATDGGAAGKTETVSLSLLREVKDLAVEAEASTMAALLRTEGVWMNRWRRE